MSASAECWVRVLVGRLEWRRVSAITEDEAREVVRDDPEVMQALEVTWNEPEEWRLD